MATTFCSAWSESGYGQDPYALAVFNGSLYFFGQIGELRLNSIKLESVLDVPYGTITTSKDQFNSAVTSMKFTPNTGHDELHSESPSACAATVAGKHLCLFWNDDRRGPMVSICDASNVNGPIRPWYRLLTLTGTKLDDVSSNGYDMAATSLDDDTILVGIQTNSDKGRNVWIGQYHLAQQRVEAEENSNDPGTWQAIAEWTLTFQQLLGNTKEAVVNDHIGTSLYLDWYSYGQPQSKSDPPTSWLGISLRNQDTKNDAYVSWLPMDYATAPVLFIGNSPGDAANVPATCFGFTNVGHSMTIRRTPSGSVHLYSTYVHRDMTQLKIYRMPGNKAPTPPRLLELSGCTLPNSTDRLDVDLPIVPAFVVSNHEVLTTVSGDTLHTGGTGALPVGEVLFAHTDDELNYYSRPFGRLQRVPDVSMLNTTSTNIVTLQGMFDGPFPMPIQNIAPYIGTTDTYADVGYGTMQQKETYRTSDESVSIGVKTSLKTTRGVGLGIEASMQQGWGWETQDGNATVSIYDIKQNVEVVNSDPPTIVSNATAFGTAMQFLANVYRFLIPDPNSAGAYIVAPDACLWAQIWAAPIGRLALPYEPYSVTPGDITSYTEEAWNSTMIKHGYPGWDYFNDVIVANAYTFPSRGRRFIEIPMAVATAPRAAEELQTSHFTETRWTFNGSVYAGMSGGGGVDIFGLGEEIQLEVLAGVSRSVNSSKSSKTETKWGITVDRIYFPAFAPKGDASGVVGVKSFTVRLFFLPASPRWTEELRAIRPELAPRIDPRSEPWRIAYLVTAYTLTDGTHYPAPKGPQAPAIAPTIDMKKMKYGAAPGVWTSAMKVKYAVRFENSLTGETTPWAEATRAPGVAGACPELTIPVDTSSPGATTRRGVLRRIDNGPEVVVKVILNNDPASSTFYDDDPKVNFQPLTSPTINPPDQWRGRVAGQSPAWTYQAHAAEAWRQTGNILTYTVTFTFDPEGAVAAGKLPSSWVQESMPSAPSASATITYYAYATLSNVPTFPTGPGYPVCTGRNIYRTVRKAVTGEYVEQDVLVGHIPDNVTTTFADLKD